MKKIILCLFLLCSFGPFATAQVTFSFDSIWVPPYICQAAEFDVEVFGMVADGSTQYGSQRFLVQNDTVWVNFEFVQGTGPATPYPLYRKITVPAPWTFGHYKIVAQGTYNGQVLQTITSGISICSGVSGVKNYDNLPGMDITLKPNPARDHFRLEGSSPFPITAIIRDLAGKIWYCETLKKPLARKINLAGLPSGLYFLEMQAGKQRTTRKFIKE